jgi:hypothetical protein
MTGGNSLHTHAVQAEEHLEQLATGLAQAGASEAVVKTVSQVAGVVRKIVTALGKGQEQTGDNEPPTPQPDGRPRTIGDATNELHQEAQASASVRRGEGG